MKTVGVPLPETRRPERAGTLLLLGCLVAGLALWSALVVGRIGEEPIPASFWLSMFVMVVGVGLLSDIGAGSLSAATFAGPLVASLWTAPRGDNDGLWLLVVPLLAVAAGFGCLLVVGVRRMALRGTRHPGLMDRLVGNHLLATSIIVAVGATGALTLLMERRANPYPELERLALAFPAPDAFEEQGVRRDGDPLCAGGCRASVELTFTTAEAPQDACETLDGVLQTWRDASARPTETIFNPTAGYFEICSWRVDVGDTDGYVAVSDEPSGTIVRVLMLDPNGVPH
jgi:hypothetical protein